jgi:hypothetical protein
LTFSLSLYLFYDEWKLGIEWYFFLDYWWKTDKSNLKKSSIAKNHKAFLKNLLAISVKKRIKLTTPYKVSHSKPAHNPYGEKWKKKAFFSNFLFVFFHFCPSEDKENKFFLCKKFDKKMHTKLLIPLSATKITFVGKNVFLTCKTENKK